MSCARFADLPACPASSCLDSQLAIASEFGRADTVATHGLLDDHARVLFELAGSPPEAQANGLLALMTRDLRFMRAPYDCPQR